MSMVHPTTELMLHSVGDRGVPDRERIILYAMQDIPDTREYGILIGVAIEDEVVNAIPLKDNFFWLGNGELKAGDWVFVYTGKGTSRRDELPDGKALISIYWERSHTVLYDPRLVPVLARFAEVSIMKAPPSPKPLPHGSGTDMLPIQE